MNRDHKAFRTLVVGTALAASIVVAGLTASLVPARAQDATPELASAIVPIVWQLTEFIDSAQGSTPVDDPSKYTIQLTPDGFVFIQADCNQGGAEYMISGNSLEFGPARTTLVACEEGSLSDRFLQELTFVRSFVIDQSEATDQLVLNLMADGGSLVFSPALTGVIWQWEQFEGGDGTVVAPDDPTLYTLQFQPDGTVNGQVDCNRGMGTYESDGSSISIVLATTRMACPEGSLDAEFSRYISEANSFVIRDGKLALALPIDSGIATFSPIYVEPGAEATPEAGG
jgi:heat shock protein HslJ